MFKRLNLWLVTWVIPTKKMKSNFMNKVQILITQWISLNSQRVVVKTVKNLKIMNLICKIWSSLQTLLTMKTCKNLDKFYKTDWEMTDLLMPLVLLRSISKQIVKKATKMTILKIHRLTCLIERFWDKS